MKNSLIRKMFIILFITVLAVAAGVFGIVYSLSYNSTMNDIRQRANGVRDYIASNLTVEDIEALASDGADGNLARARINEMLSQLRGVGNIKYLYIVQVNESGELYTSMSAMEQDGRPYIPSGELAEDLQRSLREQIQISGRGIYQTVHGSVFTVFWPVMNNRYEIIGVVGMEFDVDAVVSAYRRMAEYSLALSGALIVLFSIIAFLSMNRATEPFYKRLAYADLLTGCENRMAFEQRLREAGAQRDRGKSVTMVIFDVNNLKTVNDTLGHKQGDAYLKNTADVLAEHIGSAGSLYRIGGDEFATILIDVSQKEIQAIVENIKLEKRMMLRYYPFSCACGAATYDKNTDRTMRDIFARADGAMYDDKRRQKGKVGKGEVPAVPRGAEIAEQAEQAGQEHVEPDTQIKPVEQAEQVE